MATVNLGSIKFKWKGTYAGGTAYTIDDVVSYNGSSYICILASTGNLPTNATYFEQMSSAGTNGTNGTDLGTTLTTQGDLVYRDGSGLQRLGAGTAGQVLQTGGAGANPSWGTVSSDFVKLASINVSSTSISIDGYFTSEYIRYILVGHNITTTNSNDDLLIRVNTGGSSNTDSLYCQTNAYMYTDSTPTHAIDTQGVPSPASIDMDAKGTCFIPNGDGFSDDADTAADFTLEIYDPLASTKWKMLKWSFPFISAGKVTLQEFFGIGSFASTTALSGVTISTANTALNSGTFKLYGIKA
jgi:hypothetical protein